MPARHRSNPKTQEVCYRVYHLPEELRKAIRRQRQKRGQTVQEFIRTAVEGELTRIVETLGSLGIEPLSDDARPAKLPLDDRLLGELKLASEVTGVPQSRLVLSCLRISANRKRRPAARKK
ncbi:MAG: hypothetical protein ACYTG0_41860 [Planctomycetota bacterium]|jgi:hypothetical protein